MFEERTRSTNRERREEVVLYKARTPSAFYPEYYLPHDSFYSDSFQNYFEEMWDDNTTARKFWKPVQHYKRWVSPETTYGAHISLIDNAIESHNYRYGEHRDPYWAYRGSYGPAGAPFIGLQPMYVKTGQGQFVPDPPQLGQLQQRSLDRMLPLIKSELSIINSLIELRDFRSLPRTLNAIASLGLKGAKTLRHYFHTAADGYLQAQFNILPLLSDISGIHAAFLKISSRINDLVSRQGRVQNMHFTYSFQELTNGQQDDTSYFIMPGIVPGLHEIAPTIVRRLVLASPTVFHAEIRYNYNYLEYQAAHARVLGFLDAIGANLNPAIIWNAIPWTFVVDWVIGVSRWLNQFKYSVLTPQINILSYLWSVKRARQVYLSTENGKVDSVEFGEFVYPQQFPVLRNPLPGVHETSYRRDVSIPTISSILSSGLTLTEVSLGAALVITRKFNPKRAKKWRFKL
jgi:hypothetical protein